MLQADDRLGNANPSYPRVKEPGRNGTFHDRELTLQAVGSTGCDETHRYFLKGGVDYLPDERSDTKVFHARVTASRTPVWTGSSIKMAAIGQVEDRTSRMER